MLVVLLHAYSVATDDTNLSASCDLIQVFLLMRQAIVEEGLTYVKIL